MRTAFFRHLHRGGQYAYIHVLPAKRSTWYAIDDPLDLNPAHARTNLYFSVHPSRAIPPCNAHGEVVPMHALRSQLPFIAAINCLYAEFDAKDYGDKPGIMAHLQQLVVPPPSALVDSGGGMHAYWLLESPYGLESPERLQAAKHIQASWVAVVGGDRGAHDLTRILRVPGSWNYKYTPPRPVQWLQCNLAMTYPLTALTAHLPPVQVPAASLMRVPMGDSPITQFNAAHDVTRLLEQRGYVWRGRRKMMSPYSSTGTPGVTVDSEQNRVFVHHGSDPLHDGYWKRPFDVVCILDYGGDVRRTLTAIRTTA